MVADDAEGGGGKQLPALGGRHSDHVALPRRIGSIVPDACSSTQQKNLARRFNLSISQQWSVGIDLSVYLLLN